MSLPNRKTAIDFFLALSLVLGLGSFPSRALDPTRPLSWAIHESWTRREGLPVNAITALEQTEDGFVWIGTEEGLVRFDGLHFKIFNRKTIPAFHSDFIQDLLAASDGSLWIGTMDGVLRLHQGRFQSVDVAEAPGPARIIRLAEGPPGRLLISTSEWLGIVEGGKIKPFTTRQGKKQDGGNLAVDGRGTIWVVNDNGKRLEKVTTENIETVFPFPGGAGEVETIGQDREGTVWLSTRPKGLMRQSGDGFIPLPSPPEVPSRGALRLHAGRSGDLWIGFDDGILFRVRENRSGQAEDHFQLGNNAISALLEDREGNLWVGGQGLHRLRDAPVVTFGAREGWPEGSITSVLTDSRGKVWVGPATGGIQVLEEGQWRTLPLTGEIHEPPVISMTEDETGTLWFGTPGGGLFRLPPGKKLHSVRGTFSRDVLIAMTPGPGKENITLGASSGPYVVSRDSFREYPFVPKGEQDLPVMSLLIDRKGTIWAGTGGGGVRVLEGERWREAAQPNPLPPMILDLDEDRDGAIWACTVGSGLLRFFEGQVTKVDFNQGLPGETIYSLVFDLDDNAWLSTPSGLARIRGDELRSAATGGLRILSPDTFSYEEGLRAGETNGGGQVASRGPDGRLWFATPSGVAMIEPRRLGGAASPPRVTIEDLRCDGRGVNLKEGTEIRLPPGTARCEVFFTAPVSSGAQGVRFRFRLAGLDRDWIDAGTERTASFTHLPPGRYRFEVTAANGSGEWNSSPASLAINQRPAFYQTRWFWTFTVLALAGTVIGGYRWRVIRLVGQRNRLEMIVAERTADLAQANRTLERRVEEGISRLRETERMAAYGEMVAGVAHEVRHPVFSLRSAAYLLSQKAPELKEQFAAPLLTMERETSRLSRLMDDLLQFARPAALQPTRTDPRSLLEAAAETVKAGEGWENVEVAIETSPGLTSVPLDRDRMLQVLVNLLENARKHAAGVTLVRLAARLEPSGKNLLLVVQNDGDGILPDALPRIFEPFFTRGAGTGLGLAIVRRIITEHRGTIAVESSPETGTRFTITLPTEEVA